MATITINVNHYSIQLASESTASACGVLRHDAAYIVRLDKDIFGKNKFSYCVCIGYNKAVDFTEVEHTASINPALVFDSVEAAQAAALEAVQNIVDSCNSICDAIAQIFSGNIWTVNDEAQAADIAADYELAEVAERIAVEEAAPALPLHVNVEINKRMHSAPATLFDMQSLQNFARCMPINAEITAKNGDVYFLWGASEFPAYMAEDGSAEIWKIENSRPCRWLSISLGDAPRPAFVPERYDEDAAAEFWREDAIPF